MALFVLDHILSYQDGNDLLTMKSSGTATASPGTNELQLYQGSSGLQLRQFNGASWDNITPFTDGTNFGIGTVLPKSKLHISAGFVINDVSSQFNTGKFDALGVAWSASLTRPSLIFNGASGDRPEVAWFRGSRTYPEFAIKQSIIADNGGSVYSGTGSNPPVETMMFKVGQVGILRVPITYALEVEGDIWIQDNNVLRIGSLAGGDINIYHDSTDSFITNNTGDLNIGAGLGDLNLTAFDMNLNPSGHMSLTAPNGISIIPTLGLTLSATNGSVGITSAAFFNINMTIGANGNLNISGLPTSSAGLSTGDIWLNSNVLTRVA